MRKQYLLISLLSLFLSISVLGQDKQIERANQEFENLAYIDARQTYLNVVENGYESQDIYEKLGDSYYFNADLPNAEVWYKRLYGKYKSSMDPEYLFRYSQSLKGVQLYDRSDAVMEEFNKATGNKQVRTKIFEKERDYLDFIALQSGRFTVKNMADINSAYSDFGPSLYKGEALIFASSRTSGPSKIMHEWSANEFYDLYSATRSSGSGTAVDDVNKFRGKVKTKFHESTTAFTKDGNTMYFTRNNYVKNEIGTNNEGTMLLKLLKAEKQANGKWGNIVELPFNSDSYSVAHPALSPDGKLLYFASDMPGTLGDSDIFVVEVQGSSKFGTPKNLGKRINTEARETFPFITDSGRLFFASNGHAGLGGLDVFVTLPYQGNDPTIFGEAYNVGGPINTEFDDFAFVIEEEDKVGYFTSNRSNGMGSDDIYSFRQTKELITSCQQTLEGVVTDGETRILLPGAIVELFDSKMQKLASDTADDYGKYELPIACEETYVIRAQKGDYRPVEIDFQTDGRFDYANNVPLQLFKGASPLTTTPSKLGDDLAKILQLEPIYFDLDKSFIRPDAEVELQKVIAAMKQYPKLKIDVRSHTDSRASFSYNRNLSNRRAKSTIKYIVEKGGINSDRLTGRGYGEIELKNDCADGVDCTEEQHQLNRRSEFIIIEQ